MPLTVVLLFCPRTADDDAPAAVGVRMPSAAAAFAAVLAEVATRPEPVTLPARIPAPLVLPPVSPMPLPLTP